jgi:uncharacterized membrane protein YbhN (UPF0104 family)
MKRKLLIGTVVSVAFLYLAVRGISWSEFADAMRRTRWVFLIPGIVVTMLGHFSRSVRWKFMMDPIKECRIGPLWSATAIAFMVNNLLPARLGEFVRALAIGRSERVSRSASFATIVYERVVRPLPVDSRHRLHASADSFVDGLGVVTRPRAALPIVALSVAVWGCAVLGVYFCVLTFQLEVPLLASLFVVVVVSLGSMIPSAPAFLGTMQYACVIGLAAFGVQRAEALAFSTVYHATQFFPITIAGLWYAWRSHLRFSELSKEKIA